MIKFEAQTFSMEPLVSVLMVTHNHEKFIAAAIESVLGQKTSFGVELIIGEDASTDGTGDIVRKFSSAYPDKVFVVHHTQNLGMTKNFFHTLHRCRGKYIALLDGDDRWINENKLRLQVEFLKSHPGVVACGGQSISESSSPGKGYRLAKWLKRWMPKKLETYGREEMIISNRLRTLTVLGRADAFKSAEAGIGNSPVLDWPLYVNLTRQQEEAQYVNLPYDFGAYNVHSGGVFSGSNFASRKRISAKAREVITALTHGRYIGWHFPVLYLADPGAFEPGFLEQHYRTVFSTAGPTVLEGDAMVLAGGFLEEGKNVLEKFGFIFGSLFLSSAGFDDFTQKTATLMKMVARSSLLENDKEALMGAIGTAWRDTLFYSTAGLSTLRTFICSPLRKYAGIYWYTVVLVYRRSHIHS